jgi:YkoY family integral membrane protein
MIGGLYLIYLAADYFFSHDDVVEHPENFTPKSKIKWLSPFWGTVVMVETMDLMFSIDNVFAAVAFTDNIYLICTGVFIGIIAMRTVAVYFVKLMEKYSFLETAAFVVIAILGLKLVLSLYEHFYPASSISKFLSSHAADIGISILTVSIFFIPILTSIFFNYPKKKEV